VRIRIRYQLLKLSSFQLTMLTIWALVMVSLPIADWSTGWSALNGAITIGVIVSAGLVISISWVEWGAVETLRVAGSILVLSWAVEMIGARTGIPFGSYFYTGSLRPQILNVPVQVPLGWLMMLPPSWGVAQAIAERINPRWKFPAFVGFSALAMMAWDLFLDPIMASWGMWAWEHPGGYFGIPWTNYLGWLLASALITIILRPKKLPVVPMLLIYTTFFLLKLIGLGIFWGFPGAAVTGGFVMGGISILAWRAVIKSD
jgi:putative membrane protein